MEFLLQLGMDRQKQSLRRSIWQISLSTLGTLFLFELVLVKVLTPRLSLSHWQSVALTVVFVTLMATVIAYFELGILHATNARMASEMNERKRVEDKFRELNAILEQRVAERTEQFEAANRELKSEISDRRSAEEALREAHEKLSLSLTTLEQRSNEIAQLSEMADLLQSCQSNEEAYQIIVRTAERLFPATSGTVSVISSSRNMVETVAAWGPLTSIEHVFSPADCWGLRRSQMHMTRHPDPAKCCRHLVPAFSGIDICIPLMAQGDALGLLHLRANAPDTTAPQTSPDQSPEALDRLLNAMAKDVAMALANLKLRDSLLHRSIRDPLTGLFNRRYMEETLERELRRATRNNRPLAVIMLDLDHFKRFNDTFGHAAGDTVLREVGSFLKEQIRAGDIACRYGGEEFVLIMVETTLEATHNRAKSLVRDVRKLMIQHSGQSLGKITLSAGVAVFPDTATAPDALLAAADKALYASKTAGRDRVTLAKPGGELALPEPSMSTASLVNS